MDTKRIMPEDRKDLNLITDVRAQEMHKEGDVFISESRVDMPSDISKEAVQQTVYNLILYLPLEDLRVKNDMTIEDIVDSANKKKNKYNIDKGVLDTLNQALDSKTGYPELGEVRIQNLSYDVQTYEGDPDIFEEQHKEIILDSKAFLAATFTLDESSAKEFAPGQSLVCRGTPEKSWMDNAEMILKT